MARLEGKCPGDCTKCRLLEEGQVQMEICMLDQVFQRTRRNEEKLDKLLDLLQEKQKQPMLVREETELKEEAGTK
jgi:hypothetical protein